MIPLREKEQEATPVTQERIARSDLERKGTSAGAKFETKKKGDSNTHTSVSKFILPAGISGKAPLVPS